MPLQRTHAHVAAQTDRCSQALGWRVAVPWLVALLACVPACDESGEDDTGSSEEEGVHAELEASFDVIQAEILEPKCGQSGCHAATTGAGNLFLVGPRAYDSLLVTPCAHPTAPPNESRVRPHEVDHSYLWLRLSDHSGQFGGLMPPAQALEAHELDVIERWIRNGAPR